MQLIFANPAGWWGLLLIPAIVLIHCLHRNRRPLLISTLFLVPTGAGERRGGRSFAFWRNSVAFWLQILVALLATWLLLQPRHVSPQSTQRIAVVLDSSLSMEAYRDKLAQALETHSRGIDALAARTDWLLMESDVRAPLLYRGAERQSLLRAALQWRPRLGFHDTAQAISMARALVGAEGAVIFVTDHPPQERPHQMTVLGIGSPLDNTGFTGLQIRKHEGQTVWHTLVKNYANTPVERQWWIEVGQTATAPRTLHIPADGAVELSGALPPDTDAITLVLQADAWPVDNRLPIVRPQPRSLTWRMDAPTSVADDSVNSGADKTAGAGEISTTGTAPRAASSPASLPAETRALLTLFDSFENVAPAENSETADIRIDLTGNWQEAISADAGAATTAQAPQPTQASQAAATPAGADMQLQPARASLRFGKKASPENLSTEKNATAETATVNASASVAANAPANAAAEEAITTAKAPAATATAAASGVPEGPISASEHPLNAGLNWNSLSVQGGVLPVQLQAGETPLVWLGATPLVWLRDGGNGRELVFNFALEQSNALRLPATVLLIGRFVEQVRANKPGYQAANVELAQRMSLPLPAASRQVIFDGRSVPAVSPLVLGAPALPGFFEITADGVTLQNGAAHFADVREADLRGASSVSDAASLESRLIETNTEADAHFVWWVLLLAAALMASWHYAERGR